MSNLNVLWQPIKNSSQEIAVDTRADETLYCGTRGGGKSDTQLMAFAKYVGMGYGRYWRGIIFDQEYKNLDDLIVKSRRIFGKMPNAKYNIKDSKWTWSTGEELVFRRLRQDSDYWLYHGHEYCLPDSETIATENGSIEIKDIAVGDKVLTLDGYHKVSRKFDVGVKDCVKVEVYTLDGHFLSSQIQSSSHSILTVNGNWEQLKVGSNFKVLIDVNKGTSFKPVWFKHPYVKGKYCSTFNSLQTCIVKVSKHLRLHCYDIEVECANHYITTAGLVNKNCFIGFNELTKYPTSYLYDTIQSCNRSGFVPEEHPIRTADGKVYYLPPIPLMLFSTTNPFGAGHTWVKKRFIDVAPYGTVVKRQTKLFNPKTKQEELVEKTQVALFSSYIENIYLSTQYIASLLNYPDENIRRAWALGSWDIVSGGAVGDLWDKSKHVIQRFVIPETWYLDRTFDWGSSHPFSVGWWAMANGEEADMLLDNGEWIKFCPPKGSLIQFYEWYGTEEIGTNKGLKMSARDIAKGINQIEHGLIESGWIRRTVASGSADNQIWNNNNSDNDCIADIMESEDVYWERSDKSAGSRKNGLQLFRDMLKNTVDNAEQPHIYFMNNCIASISTIPVLPRDEKNLDDVDTSTEDHAYDMVRYRILDGVNDGSILLNVEYSNA